MLSNVPANAGVVRLKHGVALRHRDAPRHLVVGVGSFRKRPLLHFAGADGSFDVSGFEDDADDGDGPAATSYDEDHADRYGGGLHDFADFERAGGGYSLHQRGGCRGAAGPETPASSPRTSKTRALGED